MSLLSVSKTIETFCFFFFFQAEDGIRYIGVTGVQTCALPISPHEADEPLRVVEYAPSPVPCVALSERVAPLERAVRTLETAVFISSSHQIDALVEHVTVVIGPLGKGFQFLFRLSEGFSQSVNTPIVVGIFERSGHAFVDFDVVRHVTQLVIILISQSARAANGGVNGVGAMLHGLPQRLGILRANAFQVSVGHDGSRVVAHHTSPMTGACPLGKESTLPIRVGQTGLHLGIHRWIDQVKERKQTAEGVPKAGIGEHITRQSLAVVRTVVYRLPILIYLIEAPGEQYGAIEAAVKRAQMVDIIVFHLNAAQHIVPLLTALGLDFVERLLAQLLQVLLGLLVTYERRSHPGVHRFAPTGLESDDGSCVFVLQFGLTLRYMVVVGRGRKGEWLIENNDKIVLERSEEHTSELQSRQYLVCRLLLE